MIQASPKTETASPVSVSDFATFIGVEACDPVLPGLLIGATDVAIQYLRQDLIEREWVATITPSALGPLMLSPTQASSTTYELPYTALVAVDAVTVDGEPVDYLLTAWRPAKVTLIGWDMASTVTVEYRAGMDFVPFAIREGIKMIGAFLYEARGGCEASEAVKKSGASILLRPYRVESL